MLSRLFRTSRAALRRMRAPGRITKFVERLLIRDFEEFQHSNPRYSNALFLWAIDHRRRIYRRALACKFQDKNV